MKRDTREALRAAAKRNGITLAEAERRYWRKDRATRDEYDRYAAKAAGREYVEEVN